MSNGQNLGGKSREEYLADEVRVLRHQVEVLLAACKRARSVFQSADFDTLADREAKALTDAIAEVEGGAT